MRSQTTKRHLGSCITLCVLFIFPILLAACGSGSSTSDEASFGTGSVSFGVVWQDTASQSFVLKAAALSDDCTSLGVSWVTAQVLDENDNIIAEGPPEGWPCDVGEASITDVPVGDNRKLVVFAVDFNGDVLYRGESSRMTIKGGQPNIATIILKPVAVYTITATASTGGTIYPSGTVMVNNGADRTFTLTPDYGCKVTNVVVDGSEQGAITTYTFPDVDDSHTIEATFVAIWFVDGDAISSGDGKSWATAFATLEDAITHAGGGDEIWVKQGTYVISSTLAVSKTVEIYAGFVGTENQRSQRKWQNNETTVDGAGSAGCFRVTADAIIDGFIITGAYGGSGIYNDSCSPVITNCTFSGNNATESEGGGIYNRSSSPTILSSPTITNCIFSGNSANYYGAGIYNEYSSPAITNCTFSGNNATDGEGGGIYNHYSPATITNCIFSKNSAYYNGVGVCNELSSPTITNCSFSGNSSIDGEGSGIYNSHSSPSIINCTFSENSTNGWGGGGISNNYSSPAITNCTFFGNSAYYYGGGISNYSSFPTITNCTFSGNNTSELQGGGIFNRYSSPIITNCILWDDTAATDGPEIYDESGSSATVTYCNIDQDGYEGDNGNIRQDPLFGTDLHLQANSPCIDKADSASSPPYDIDGEARPQGDGYDMGADEFYDSDGDGMPDYWEIKYGLNPSADDSILDPDRDGRTNLEEYQSNTNPLDASPTAEIYSPSNGTYDVDVLISFSGTGYDIEDGELTGDSLVWTSSINGLIGTGTDFSINNLSAGTHTITLTATDSQGATGSDSIIISVNDLPIANINTPTDGSSFFINFDEPISFSGTGFDPEDGKLTGNSLVWTSEDGQIGIGEQFRSTLSDGTHTITLTVTDSQGATVSTEITIQVYRMIE